MSEGQGHRHDRPARRRPAGGGPDDGAFDWFKILDYVVWGAVGILVILAVEWVSGHIVREKIVAGAEKYLASKTTQPES